MRFLSIKVMWESTIFAYKVALSHYNRIRSCSEWTVKHKPHYNKIGSCSEWTVKHKPHCNDAPMNQNRLPQTGIYKTVLFHYRWFISGINSKYIRWSTVLRNPDRKMCWFLRTLYWIFMPGTSRLLTRSITTDEAILLLHLCANNQHFSPAKVSPIYTTSFGEWL